MAVLIIIGVVVLCLLGLLLGTRVVRSRRSLDAKYQSDPERAARLEQDAQINAQHSRWTRNNPF